MPDADPIIGEILEKYKSAYGDEFTLSELNIYGSKDVQLFKISDIEKILDMSNIRKLLISDKKNDIRFRIYTEDEDYIKAKVKNDSGKINVTVFFTKSGLYKYLITSQGLISNIFRNFLIKILDRLVTGGNLTLTHTIDELKDKLHLIDDLEDKNIKLEDKDYEVDGATDKIVDDAGADDENIIVIEHLQNEIKRLNGIIQDDSSGDIIFKNENTFLKKRYMRKLYIYLIDAELVINKVMDKSRDLSGDTAKDKGASQKGQKIKA